MTELLENGGFIINIVYFDYGGTHTSVTAACIHVGKLKPNIIPTTHDLMEMPFLDKTNPEDFGKIKFIGDDNKGNKIYSLGTKYSKMGELLKDIVKFQGVEDQYLFVCTSPYVNNTLRIGGWLSRAASLPAIGRPLVVSGLKMAYTALCSFVETNAIKLKGTA